MAEKVKLTKHVIRDGSRDHVISWIGTVRGVIRQCSCPACEVNEESHP